MSTNCLPRAVSRYHAFPAMICENVIVTLTGHSGGSLSAFPDDFFLSRHYCNLSYLTLLDSSLSWFVLEFSYMISICFFEVMTKNVIQTRVSERWSKPARCFYCFCQSPDTLSSLSGLPLRALTDTFFPQMLMTVSRCPFQPFDFPLFRDETKGITA